MRTPERVCIALLLGATACSGAAPDLFAGDAAAGAPRDASVPEAAPVEMEAESPVDATVVTGDEPSVAIDASGHENDAAVESGTEIDAGTDAGMPPSACSMICTGCCDATGKCRTGNAVALCGVMGAACDDCSANKCPLTEAPCCGTKGCGCAVAGLIGCN
jgi:hypothetical protein